MSRVGLAAVTSVVEEVVVLAEASEAAEQPAPLHQEPRDRVNRGKATLRVTQTKLRLRVVQTKSPRGPRAMHLLCRTGMILDNGMS